MFMKTVFKSGTITSASKRIYREEPTHKEGGEAELRQRTGEDMEAITSTVTSKDGTKIAYDKMGHGPAVILVAGALCSRSFWSGPELAKLLAHGFTVYNYDRRGRGESDDTKPYGVGPNALNQLPPPLDPPRPSFPPRTSTP